LSCQKSWKGALELPVKDLWVHATRAMFSNEFGVKTVLGKRNWRTNSTLLSAALWLRECVRKRADVAENW
jgi:hypothetical protein